MSAPLGQLVSAVTDDPDVRAAVKQLALDVVGEAQRLMRVGSPQIRARIIASVMPAAVAGLKQAPEDESKANLRAELEEMFRELRG
jgi:hypothetical protein